MATIAPRRDLPQVPSQNERAALRKRQLVTIADALLEEGGVEAVSMARVAEIAGCARTLVYRYFPTREDLLGAVVELFYERLDEITASIDPERAGGGLSQDVSVHWDAILECGLGGAVLRSTPLVSAELRSLMGGLISKYERRFTEPFAAAGFSEQQTQSIMDALIASFTNLLLRVRRGEITREQGIELHSWVIRGLLRGVRQDESHGM